MALKIECPICGMQYLPGEIYIPKHFLGQPSSVNRDDNGKIVSYEGIPQELKESYVCDHCGNQFTVCATIKFSTQQAEQLNQEYTTKIKNTKLTLTE